MQHIAYSTQKCQLRCIQVWEYEDRMNFNCSIQKKRPFSSPAILTFWSYEQYSFFVIKVFDYCHILDGTIWGTGSLKTIFIWALWTNNIIHTKIQLEKMNKHLNTYFLRLVRDNVQTKTTINIRKTRRCNSLLEHNANDKT